MEQSEVDRQFWEMVESQTTRLGTKERIALAANDGYFTHAVEEWLVAQVEYINERTEESLHHLDDSLDRLDEVKTGIYTKYDLGERNGAKAFRLCIQQIYHKSMNES